MTDRKSIAMKIARQIYADPNSISTDDIQTLINYYVSMDNIEQMRKELGQCKLELFICLIRGEKRPGDKKRLKIMIHVLIEAINKVTLAGLNGN